MVQTNKEQDRTVLKGEDNYFEGEKYDDDLIFNSTYEQNDVLNGMHICNVFLEKGDCIKTTDQNEDDDEAIFLGVLPNNTVYLSWQMYFCKNLFVEEENIICIKKVDGRNKIYKIWERKNGNEDFKLTKHVKK